VLPAGCPHHQGHPAEVTTDKAPVYPGVLEELLPASWHRTDRYANNRVQCDHGRLKHGCVRCEAKPESTAPELLTGWVWLGRSEEACLRADGLIGAAVWAGVRQS
jgi:transposase-like protein